MDTPPEWAGARDDPAFVAGWDRCLEQVLAGLEGLRTAPQPTSPVWAPLYVAGWQAALGSVRAHLVALQAEQDAEGEGVYDEHGTGEGHHHP